MKNITFQSGTSKVVVARNARTIARQSNSTIKACFDGQEFAVMPQMSISDIYDAMGKAKK